MAGDDRSLTAFDRADGLPARAGRVKKTLAHDRGELEVRLGHAPATTSTDLTQLRLTLAMTSV
jgi:hypothetical protein